MRNEVKSAQHREIKVKATFHFTNVQVYFKDHQIDWNFGYYVVTK